MIERIIKLLKIIADRWSSAGKIVYAKYCPGFILVLLLCNTVAGQNCTVINSIPATPPTSGVLDLLVAAPAPGAYSSLGSKIFNSYDVAGIGPAIQIDTAGFFWKDHDRVNPGPFNRCAVWGKSNPKVLGFSVCIDIPADKTYYMGFGADNSGTLTIDGKVILKNISYEYWGIYKISLSKGKHFVEFTVINFEDVAALGFEIYDNTQDQIIKASGYADLNLIFSTRQEIGAQVQIGDPATSYSCPVGYIHDYCSSNIPVCSQFVPMVFTVHNPPPACSSLTVDITTPQITAGTSSSVAFSYWKDSLATIPLDHANKITTNGTYYIMGSSNGCYMIKPVLVSINSANTITNKAICQGDSYLGHNQTGSYTDTLKTAGGCDSIITVNIRVTPGVNLGPDRTICAGDTVLLNAGGFTKYLWQDNTTEPNYVVKAPGTYWVTVGDQNGCLTSDTVMVKLGGCFNARIPSAFTPNGDGVNDTWNITGLQYFPQCSVFVYDRWGQLVFKSTGYSKSWDGTISGKNLPVTTYYYVIDLKNKTQVMSGFVSIIR